MSPHGNGSALGSCEMLGAVVVDVVAWSIHPLLMLLLLLLLLMGLHNLSPSWHWDQAVQGHLLAVHVHLVDDWEAVDRNNVVVKALVVMWINVSKSMVPTAPK